MTNAGWDTFIAPDDGNLWELFHENSKFTRESSFPSNEAVLEAMREMDASMPARAFGGIALPPPIVLTTPLEQAIRGRVSARSMTAGPMTLAEMATLLEAAYGVTRDNAGTEFPRPFRTIPSAGALYPLEIFFHATQVTGLPAGIYHYNPSQRTIHPTVPADRTAALRKCLVQPEVADQASLVVFVTALFERSAFKYGDRAYRFALLEAGHLAQNLLLAASALRIASLCLGGYYDHDLDALLGLNGVTHSTVYVIACGAGGSV